MRPALPDLAYLFGLRWEHIETMPHDELQTYLDARERIAKAGS